MISLLIGFIIPAVVFAIFGLIACLRRSSASHCTNKRSYAIIPSNIGRMPTLNKFSAFIASIPIYFSVMPRAISLG
ncbi:unnamed protein product [Toxocara canis]|uniref:Secreted protein n=1 Tax=Toxocara canis TaxID=6265 RepID=A0A183U0Y7_TOXCA|nr:unnamed protein product [Toxocara canis]